MKKQKERNILSEDYGSMRKRSAFTASLRISEVYYEWCRVQRLEKWDNRKSRRDYHWVSKVEMFRILNSFFPRKNYRAVKGCEGERDYTDVHLKNVVLGWVQKKKKSNESFKQYNKAEVPGIRCGKYMISNVSFGCTTRHAVYCFCETC